jgi:HTH-type transcriptional regulator / antitoxin HigA
MSPAVKGRGPRKYDPDYAVPSGATLRDVIIDRDMTQSELAARADLSLKHINQIIHGAAPITAETALSLEKVTGVPSMIWNRLEANYRDRLARLEDRDALAADIEWVDSLPLKELRRRGLLPQAVTGGALVDAVCRFFGVANRQGWEKVWRTPLASFRKSRAFTADVGAVATWLRLGELEAADRLCRPFDPKGFREALHEIRGVTEDPEFEEKMVELSAANGVAVVFVREIPGTRASGAARWLSPTKALIQLSLRHKRDDHFWFSFFHEAAHILLHSKKQTFVSGNGEQDEDLEEEANDFAASLLIPKRFERELAALRSPVEIQRFAAKIGIAPGIVVGRLQNEGILDWGSRANKLKRPIDFAED